MPAESAVLIPLLPLLGGAFVGLFGFRLREHSWKLGVPAIVAAFVLSIWTLYAVDVAGPIRLVVFQPQPSLPVSFAISLFVDRLSAVMMVLITGVSTIIHLYSIRYMQDERGYARFFALLGLMSFVLLAMVTTANLFMLFVYWQLVSWLLYLLLVYNYTYRPAVASAFKSLAVFRVGDVAFLGGVVLAYRAYGTLELPALFERAAQSASTIVLWPGGPELSVATAITLLLFVGAMAKSAQLPLPLWLPDTMDTPTPVSALMHAGIVNAAGFLINRLAPLYGLTPETLHVVFVVGGLTAVLGAAMMLTQSDIKKMLGFSTMGQMGYMVMECGLGAFALAIFHLVAHGIFKATLFLYAGNVIHVARREPKFPPSHEPGDTGEFPRLHWFTGLVMTLILPLVILLVAHGVLRIPLRDQQGAVIFLFFAWVTSSQALLSLYRLRAMESWKVAALMVLTLVLVVLTYLWAAEAFSYYLYPAPGEVAHYFKVAAFPLWLFDLFIVVVTLLVIAGWAVAYTSVRGRQTLISRGWATALAPRLYVWFLNRLYVDALYVRTGQGLARLSRRLDAHLPEWWP